MAIDLWGIPQMYMSKFMDWGLKPFYLDIKGKGALFLLGYKKNI